jgi:NAD(P)-dependent dehydrogenase (short-subunit alcohol dehydrogenase family)
MTQLPEHTTQAAENAAATPKIFDQRVALVTGGARGIGWAITQALAAAGAHVAAGYNRDRGAAEKLQEEITQAGGSMSIHQGNVGEPADCQRFVDDVLAAQGHIDFLINNAGITVDKTVRRMTMDDWHAVLRINLSGPFHMTKAVLEHMLERGSGRIINISSVIGQTGSVGQANYAASKSGLFGFSQSLALETARKGITVNCVAPGFIETEMVAAVPKEVLDKIVDAIPMGRLGQAGEVARVVKFLLEDGSSYITGAVYTVNGGLEM